MCRAEEWIVERRAEEWRADEDRIVLECAVKVAEERVEELERVGEHVPAVRAGPKGCVVESAVGERVASKGIAGVGLRVSGLFCGWRPYAVPVVKLRQVSDTRVGGGGRS